jgi:hypothetical protein
MVKNRDKDIKYGILETYYQGINYFLNFTSKRTWIDDKLEGLARMIY